MTKVLVETAGIVLFGIIAVLEVAFFGWALTDVRRRFPAHRRSDRPGHR
jgi:hypothetical protein